jgi:hypothetical protein
MCKTNLKESRQNEERTEGGRQSLGKHKISWEVKWNESAENALPMC